MNKPTQQADEAIEFRTSDKDFLAWIAKHQQGFVLNRLRASSANYLVLHKARCILFRTEQDSPYAFTGNRLIKICATGVAPLEAHATQQGGTLTRCRVCNP